MALGPRLAPFGGPDRLRRPPGKARQGPSLGGVPTGSRPSTNVLRLRQLAAAAPPALPPHAR
ncbi:MAG TPA: hypothetical protein VME46_19520 [Acidimicrobiales bacterium]|nr:hypothetical protein [Acidimicrobiales bacterium]